MSVDTSYESRPTSRARRSRAEINHIKDAIVATLTAEHPMTVRQLFYQLVSAGIIGKTEAEYKGTVVRLTGEMRRSKEIPFSWLADNTRWMLKPESHSSLEEMLELTQNTYRRALWDNQSCDLEIWLEKDALSGVLYQVTSKWDVPLMVTRGYPSLSFLHGAAASIEAGRKPTYLYYLGDHDPSGLDITRVVEQNVRAFAPTAEIMFERVAVTLEQIEEFSLPTRPTKVKDSRSKGFVGGSVEVDALPPAKLREPVESLITRHVEPGAYEAHKLVEKMERDYLAAMIAGGNADEE